MPLVRIRDIKTGKTETFFKGDYSQEYVLHNGDYIIGMDGEFNITEWQGGEALLNQRVCRVIVSSDKVLPKYILYFLPLPLKRIEEETPFVTVKHLSSKKLNDVIVPVPTIEEQQRIVDELDLLNGIIDKKNAQLRDLDALAQSIFYEMFGDPITNDRGWPAKAIGEFAEVTDYVANGSFATLRANVSYKSEPDYAVLVRLADFSNGFDKSKFVYVDKHAYDFLAKSKLLGGEIIMSNVGSVGKAFLCPDLKTPMSLAPNSILIRTPNNVFSFACFKMPSFQEAIREITSQTALPKFNKTEFKKIRIINPDAFSQKQFEEKWQAIKFKETSIIASLNDAKQLLDSRMAFYFS